MPVFFSCSRADRSRKRQKSVGLHLFFCNGIAKVRGSIPLGSTIPMLVLNALRDLPVGFSKMMRESIGQPMAAALVLAVWSGVA